jgi:outer membrane immunogenic protein
VLGYALQESERKRMRKAGLAIVSLIVWAVLAPAGLAQDLQRIELSLNAGGVFTKDVKSTSGVVAATATKSLAVFGSVQYRFTRMHSLELSVGHSNNSQVFVLAPNAYRIATAVTGYSGAYLFSPWASKNWEPFLLGGVGGLRFSPGKTYIDGFQASFGAGQQTSLAFVYGAGVDHHLWRILNLRVQYRGFLYKAPDFKLQSLYSGARGHMAEPSIGLAVKF